jgi:hypothetical protein
MYDDAQREIDVLMEKMSNTYELPPYDLIGWDEYEKVLLLFLYKRRWYSLLCW